MTKNQSIESKKTLFILTCVLAEPGIVTLSVKPLAEPPIAESVKWINDDLKFWLEFIYASHKMPRHNDVTIS
jgi:hypothetical protein